MYIVNGYKATISGQEIVFDSATVNWRELRVALAEVMNVPDIQIASYVPCESAPDAKLANELHEDEPEGVSLRELREWTLMPVGTPIP